MMLLMVIQMACLRDQYWHLHLALLLVKCLDLHYDLLMESHLGLMKELSWVLHMAYLMVLMKELSWVLHMVL